MLTLRHITLSRGNKLLLDKASVSLYEKQKIGLIGHNGCGKSTLFDFLLGKPFGIFIDDTAVAMVQLKPKGSEGIIVHQAEKSLPEGVMSRGKILKKELLVTVLKETYKDSGIHQKSCVVTLSEAQSYEYVFRFPATLKTGALKKMVEEKNCY